jgi:transcriptional regulator with XRE-family HTH domain
VISRQTGGNVMPGIPVTEEQRKELGRRIDSIRHAEGLSYAGLADRAGYDEKTVRSIVKGEPKRARTLLDVCKAVGIDLHAHSEIVEVADELHGGYTKRSLSRYVGRYLAYRWSYQDDLWIICSSYNFDWSETHHCMRFLEDQRYEDSRGKLVDFSQEGDIYTDNESGLLHLLTVAEGVLRLITVTRLQLPELTLKGCALTQSRAGIYRPAVSPVFFKKVQDNLPLQEVGTSTGEIAPGDPGHAELAAELREIEHEVVRSTFAMGVAGKRGLYRQESSKPGLVRKRDRLQPVEQSRSDHPTRN